MKLIKGLKVHFRKDLVKNQLNGDIDKDINKIILLDTRLECIVHNNYTGIVTEINVGGNSNYFCFDKGRGFTYSVKWIDHVEFYKNMAYDLLVGELKYDD